MGWQGRRVLVTGGEGFIGSHLVERLVREGAEVRVLAYYNSFGKWGWLDEVEGAFEIFPGDVRDAERVFAGVDGMDTVFHLAALIGIPYSYEAPESYIQTNITGTHNVARACLRAGVRRMVHTSTSEVYGSAIRVPIDEDHPLQPQSPYSASKIGADMMALSFHHAFKLPLAIARPFNTYGPRQSTRAVIPTILAQLLSGANEIRLGSLTPTRDFTFVEDTAAGFLAVAESDRALGHVVNIGSGTEISMGDLAQLLVRLTGRDAQVTLDPERIRPSGSEVDRLLCDNSRAREWAGWRPHVSLEDGLRATAEWVASHLTDLEAQLYQK